LFRSSPNIITGSAMQVAILAGGLATRLRPLTENIPKPMVRVSGRPFLEHQLNLLKENGIRDIVLCLGYLGKKVESYFGDGTRFGVNLKYSFEGKQLLGTAGALKNAQELLEDEFFVMYCDSYLLLDFEAVVSYFKKHHKLALMTVFKNHDRYEPSNVVVEGDLVRRYSKREKTRDMVYIDYGLNILRKEALNLVPPHEPYSLEELYAQLIDRQELLAYEVQERFYQIGSFEGLAEFEAFISGRSAR